MEYDSVIQLFRGSIVQILLLSAPVLIVSAIVGFLLSIFQAVTSLQDQTLTMVPKLFAILAALAYFAPWMFNTLLNYTRDLFSMIPMLTL